jgi:hypothetical protein
MEKHLKYIDTTLKNHLQKEVSLFLNDKVYKTGKFILYSFQDYHIEFDVIFNNKIKKILLPVPFNIEHYIEDNLIYFDYRIKSLYTELAFNEKQNRFYNKILEIQFK